MEEVSLLSEDMEENELEDAFDQGGSTFFDVQQSSQFTWKSPVARRVRSTPHSTRAKAPLNSRVVCREHIHQEISCDLSLCLCLCVCVCVCVWCLHGCYNRGMLETSAGSIVYLIKTKGCNCAGCNNNGGHWRTCHLNSVKQ